MDSRDRAREWVHDNTGKYTEELTRNLAALIDEVRAEERERCAEVCEREAEFFRQPFGDDTPPDYLRRFRRAKWQSAACIECAAAIRGMTRPE